MGVTPTTVFCVAMGVTFGVKEGVVLGVTAGLTAIVEQGIVYAALGCIAQADLCSLNSVYLPSVK